MIKRRELGILDEKCPNPEFFLVVFVNIRTEYGDLQSKKLLIRILFSWWEIWSNTTVDLDKGVGCSELKKDNLSGLCDREVRKMFNSIFFSIEHFLATDSDKKNIARITISSRRWPEGSHKLGSVLPFVRPSFLPAVFLELGR